MEAINRRGFLRSIVGGAAVVTVRRRQCHAASKPNRSGNDATGQTFPKAMEDFVEDAQYWYGRRRRVYRRYYRRRG